MAVLPSGGRARGQRGGSKKENDLEFCSGAGGEGLLVAGGWRGLYIDTVRTAPFGQGSSPQPPGGDAAGLSPHLDLCEAPATDEVG